jgi:hypothetical protein
MMALPIAKEEIREHAILSASGAYKWLHCTPSARLEEQFPETTSVYAEEGCLAHAIAELKLRKLYTEPMGTRKFNAALKKLQAHELYQEEMLHYTDAYVEFIQSIVHQFNTPPHVAIEKRLDLRSYVPESFGTGDCIIIGGRTLHIIDFKYGKGVPVTAEDNPQMLLYALGALDAYWMLYEIDSVMMSIVQPRLDNTDTDEMCAADLRGWGESIKPIAQRAWNGEGECVPGEHCRFCKAKAQCRARSEAHTALEAFDGKLPPLLSNEEIGDILKRAQQLKTWVSQLEEYALSEVLIGNEIPGWKAVEGRSIRQFVDTDAAFKVMKAAGYDEALLYERKPITLTSVEKLLGKSKFNELLIEHVNKPPGKPTLVPESDNREAITNKTTAEEAFGKTDEGRNEK